MTARLVRARAASVHEAASLAGHLLSLAQERGSVCAAALTTRGPAVLLGHRQRASAVLDEEACRASETTVLRRDTTGAHVFIGPGGAAVFALALPSIDALVDDARPATVLNRNVRGWLSALTRSSAIAHYFGRDWLSIGKRPCGSIGLRRARSGAVVIELWLGSTESTALPRALASDRERSTDRWLAKSPASYFECAGRDALDLSWCDDVQRRTLARYAVEPTIEPDSVLPSHERASDAVELGGAWRWVEPTSCAIGWIDAAITSENTVWIGGDPLVSDGAIAALSEALATVEQRVERVARVVGSEVALGADAEAWLRCGAALDAVVRSTSL